MTNEVLDFAVLTLGIAILAFLWNFHRDVADLRERMAHLEGLLEGFKRAHVNFPDARPSTHCFVNPVHPAMPSRWLAIARDLDRWVVDIPKSILAR